MPGSRYILAGSHDAKEPWGMGWLPVGEGYQVTLVNGRVAARATTGRSAGKELRSLPKALRDHPEVERLRRLAEWLARHDAACLAQAEAWMMAAQPVPAALIGQVWPDEAWQSALRDLVVVGAGPAEAGFLRDAAGSGELRIVNLDGETARLSRETVTLPHPVLLPDLDELRDFAAELGVTQRVEQIHRATWLKPDGLPAGQAEVREFAGGKFPGTFTLAGRATSLGYRVDGGYATCRARDGGQTAEAMVWIGEPYWDGETETGPLSWRGGSGRLLPLADVGPVAWSEGMRMAAALYAGRELEEGTGA
jgi:hypothetical protein